MIFNIKCLKTRRALSRAHTSATAQKSPLITSKQMPGETYPVLQGMTQPQPNCNSSNVCDTERQV